MLAREVHYSGCESCVQIALSQSKGVCSSGALLAFQRASGRAPGTARHTVSVQSPTPTLSRAGCHVSRARRAQAAWRQEAGGVLAAGALVAFQRGLGRAPGAAWADEEGPALDVGLLQRVQGNGRWMAVSSRCESASGEGLLGFFFLNEGWPLDGCQQPV